MQLTVSKCQSMPGADTEQNHIYSSNSRAKSQSRSNFVRASSSPKMRPLYLAMLPLVRIWHCSHVRGLCVKGHLLDPDSTACSQ